MKEYISVSQPIIDDAEKQAVMEVLDSGMLAQGPVVAALEDEFADYCGVEHAVALSSGTAAIHTALNSVRVSQGDVVITSPFTFIGTVNPILMQGANVRFVDIEADTFNLNPDQLEDAYSTEVKAIIPIDLFGQPADYDPITQFAENREIAVVEDACQSIGATYHSSKTGSLGTVACFSLYATKNIMSGEGGILTTDDEDIAANAKSFRQHGMDRQYDYSQLGYNYRTTDILAAIARVQLARADELTEKRNANAQELMIGLDGIRGIILPKIAPDRTSSFHQFTIRITDEYPTSRNDFREAMKERGISTGVYYPKPLHLYPHIKKLGFEKGDFPVAEQMAEEVISIPVHPSLTKDQLEFIIKSVHEVSGV